MIDLICMGKKKNQCQIDTLHPQIHILLPTEQMQIANDITCSSLELAGWIFTYFYQNLLWYGKIRVSGFHIYFHTKVSP